VSRPAGQRVLVTGAGGFVGANLVRWLVAAGHDVTAVVRPAADLWRLEGMDVATARLDIRDRAATFGLLRAVRPAWVFHLAAHGGYSWQVAAADIVATNAVGTVNLVDAAVEHDVESVIHAGSSSEYGVKDHAPSESELLEPGNAYAVAKVAATLYGQATARRTDRHLCTLRLYSVYGPWEEPKRLVPTLVSHCLRGSLPPLVAPDTARDFVHVDDVSEAFVRIAMRTDLPRGTVLNIGSGRQTTMADIVAVAREMFSVTIEPDWGTMPARTWDASVWVADASLAERQLGWRATIRLDEGLSRVGRWLTELPTSTAHRYAPPARG
jgi:UDP-glucose 4-epimerase